MIHDKFLEAINNKRIVIITFNFTSKAGTITENEDRYMEWKTVDGNYEDTRYASFDTLFKGVGEKIASWIL